MSVDRLVDDARVPRVRRLDVQLHVSRACALCRLQASVAYRTFSPAPATSGSIKYWDTSLRSSPCVALPFTESIGLWTTHRRQ